MSSAPNLDAYFERIGYEGSRAPTRRVLDHILERHVRCIPFENIDVFLGVPVSIDLSAIEQKLVTRRRGGYCFEHNTLLLHVLGSLGFEVEALSARSRYQQPERTTLPRTHVFLQVVAEGQNYLVDGGFGGMTPTAALELASEDVQPTPHEPRRLLREGTWAGPALRSPDARLVHQAFFGDAWHDLYEFTLERMPLSDREMGNWFTSAHPKSRFKQQLMVARSTADGRLSLKDLELTHHRQGVPPETTTLRSGAELADALLQYFGLALPEVAALRVPVSKTS